MSIRRLGVILLLLIFASFMSGFFVSYYVNSIRLNEIEKGNLANKASIEELKEKDRWMIIVEYQIRKLMKERESLQKEINYWKNLYIGESDNDIERKP